MSPATSRQQSASTLTQRIRNAEIAGFMIDENGQEIAITEQMIQQACAALESQWCPAPQRANAS